MTNIKPDKPLYKLGDEVTAKNYPDVKGKITIIHIITDNILYGIEGCCVYIAEENIIPVCTNTY